MSDDLFSPVAPSPVELHDYRITCLSEALSPITHMAGVAGNESLVMRETIRTPEGGTARVPVLSGNALRHVAIREPMAVYLIGRYNLAGRLTPDQQQFLFNGGANTTSGRADNYKLVADLQHAWPILRVLGGTLPSQVFAGSLIAERGVLVCRENRERIAALAPAGWSDGVDLARLRPAESFIGGHLYVRGKAGDDSETQYGSGFRMMFSGQHVVPGSLFLHGFILRRATRVELGALLWSLSLWQESGGIVGGMSAKGHGRMRTEFAVDGGNGGDGDGGAADVSDAIAEYLQAVEDRRPLALAALDAAFAKPVEKKAGVGGRGGKKKTAASSPVEEEMSTEGAADGA